MRHRPIAYCWGGIIACKYQELTQNFHIYIVCQFEKITVLQILDHHWREHLIAMDLLRTSVNLRGYAQKDPRNEYKKEAFQLFANMLSSFKYDTIVALNSIADIKIEKLNKVNINTNA